MPLLDSALPIRLLDPDPNRRGDLFGRLMGDVFVALGYERIRYNVHKAGREVDILATHRTERRKAVGECKATKDVIGGDDLNKFYGVLDLEKRRSPDLAVEGYFISLAGFRETALEQELEVGGERFVAMDGERVIRELTDGRIIVSRARALGLAGKLCPRCMTPCQETHVSLLAHELGWLWRVAFGHGMDYSHFTLVHADGDLLPSRLAAEVVSMDKLVGGELHTLEYLAPSAPTPDANSDIGGALNAYRRYLAREFGQITLEGLPADQEVGSANLPLGGWWESAFGGALARG